MLRGWVRTCVPRGSDFSPWPRTMGSSEGPKGEQRGLLAEWDPIATAQMGPDDLLGCT